MVEKRGRKSAADGELEVVPLIPGDAKPGAPPDLSIEEAEVWKSVVDAMPLRYFGRETWPVLRALCAHQVAANFARERYLKAVKGKTKPDMLEALARLYNRETEAVYKASEKLRLTKSSRGHPIVNERQKANQVIKRPWDD